MKKPFCFTTDLPIRGKELRCPGHLELSGTAMCDHPKDTDSYDYVLEDVILIVNGVRSPFYSIIESLSNGEPGNHPVIKPAIEAHLLWLFNDDQGEDTTTDRRQVNLFAEADTDEQYFPTTDNQAA